MNMKESAAANFLLWILESYNVDLMASVRRRVVAGHKDAASWLIAIRVPHSAKVPLTLALLMRLKIFSFPDFDDSRI